MALINKVINDHVCIGEQFQWSDVYSKQTGEDLSGC